jgi:diaminohydroxyphosphoribosylaminopyrimidine deaminase/5-amino-6-(5-phosphoribosylamino)uracil reductase
MSAADDRRYMAAALRLSRWHSGATGANPSVGCLVVKHGSILGAAVTATCGRPHAETQALEIAGKQARGATAYVTLEPCSHYGKTPPCANALVEAGIARVVVCLTDPDARVSGRGLAILREARITVDVGVLAEEGRRMLAGYLMRKTQQRPHVTLKLALSADAMLGRRGEEVLITGPLARAQVHVLRAESDAILVGIGTVMADDPELTVRLAGMKQLSPIRVILDRRLELPLGSNLVRSAHDVPVIAVTSKLEASSTGGDGREARRQALSDAGVQVIEVADLTELLQVLAGRGISSLFVEGGANVSAAFFDAGLADRVILSQGPATIGEGGLESPLKPTDMPQEYRLIRAEAFGPDRCYEFERSS